MADVAHMDRAASWADALVKSESRGPGDLDNAMRRAARKAGVPYTIFWRLRYRPPADLFVSVFNKLEAAYLAECERQIKRLQHDIQTTKAITGADRASVRASVALVGSPDVPPKAE